MGREGGGVVNVARFKVKTWAGIKTKSSTEGFVLKINLSP